MLPWTAANYTIAAKGSLVIAVVLTVYSGAQYWLVAIRARRAR